MFSFLNGIYMLDTHLLKKYDQNLGEKSSFCINRPLFDDPKVLQTH
jgi:hypothetical protein